MLYRRASSSLFLVCVGLTLPSKVNVSPSPEFQADLPDFLKLPPTPPPSATTSTSYTEDPLAPSSPGSGEDGATLRPFIDPKTPTNVTVVSGKTATLACVVRNLGTASVSWMRIRDLNVLSLNELTNTKDSRIRAIHVPKSDRWALRIQETKVSDAGGYECQVTTANKTIEIINLNVLDPVTRILGPKEVFLSKGSTLNLTCVVSGGPLRQPFIIWTHDDKMLQYVSSESELSASTPTGLVVSRVLLAETQVANSGRYACEPGEAPADYVMVHVIDGKVPAAMQRAPGALSPGLCSHPLAALLAALIQLRYFQTRWW